MYAIRSYYALKFLSVSDQANHWGILDREVYIAAWIVIFGLLGLYLLGKIKFAHDSEVKYLSVPRLFVASVVLVFVVYVITSYSIHYTKLYEAQNRVF